MSRWPEVPVAALAIYRNGYAFRPDDRGLNGLPIVRIEQLLNDDAPVDRHSGEGVPASNRIDSGDLIFSWSGSLAVIVWNRGPGLLNQHLFRVDPLPEVDRRWLRWALTDAIVRMRPLMHGSAMTHITKRVLEETQVPLPPTEEQRRIADYLDTETARIDALIAKNEQAAALVEERHATVLNEAFGLRFLRRSDGVPIGLGGIPTAPLGLVAKVQSGLTKNAAGETDDLPAWPYLRVANVQDGELDLQEIRSVKVEAAVAHRHSLRPGDVLMTEGGDPDKLGRGAVFRGEIKDCLHQNHVFAVRPRPDLLLPEFLGLATRSLYARTYFEMTSSKTTGIASTSARKIGEWRTPVPDLARQQQIVQDIGAADETRAFTVERLHDQVELLRERRDALITAAVTGEIEV